ncbi:uncharacterized protein J4E84_004633 [Alternaria hordeiaustralica]|uniref:uncharacterized protein n=1 Tax=Alternaria hordeiaustralica TaxID=1187925 RepID=UPI0020C38AEA|nr:uncharacterized protein J4E84_004633 [Alternaria hordeiaustralica]KAI4688703.1 hypothetical protein J4E84_004633 [Alternaria hordeiaustralica]
MAIHEHKIYDYYIVAENGYFYNPETRKMMDHHPSSVSPKPQVINTNLIKTCKIAAAEMKGLALERNEVIFHAMCSVNDGDGCLDLNSRAGRFKSLLKCRQIQRIRMLVCTASLLTTDDYTRLAQEYPDFAFWFDGPLRRAIRGRTDGLNMDSTNDCIDSLFSSGDFDRALQLALELAKARNPLTFARLAVKTFGDEYPERLRVSYEPRRGNLFSEGSLCTLFEWKPEPWRIPSHEELTSIEALLSMKAVRGMETFYSAHNTKWYFSATSVAIQYLETLNPKVRMVLRNIVIREDFKSVSNPELHARGLIPFCRENANLRITQHVSLFESMLPSSSGGQDNRRSFYYDRDSVWGPECLEAMINLIQVAFSLQTLGMPNESFSLVFDNSVTEGDWVWNTIVMRTAALQEVFTRWLRARSIILRTNEGREPGGYGRLWDVPSTFAANVRSIAEGNAIMQLTSRMSSVEIKATDLDLNSRMHYTFGDWDDEWNAGHRTGGLQESSNNG